MKLPSVAAVLAFVVTSGFAQTIELGYPTNGAVLHRGKNFTAEVILPFSMASCIQVGIALALDSCSNGVCPQPQSQLGSVLYAGPWNPVTLKPGQGYYQDFTMQISEYQPKGHAIFTLTHLCLLGTVCSYYLRGACKYGERCRNEHPPDSSARANFANQTWTATTSRIAVPYTTESIAHDITPYKDKPLWPLSSYGPAKHEVVVIGGLDESPEELRLKAVTALKTVTIHEYVQYESEKIAAADQMYANARNNVQQLYEQAVKLSGQAQMSGSTPGTSTSAFGNASAFGGSAFSSTSTASAFGSGTTPSAFAGPTTSAFGKSAFGQPTFGQTGFGATAGGTSAFSQAAQGTSTFGITQQPVSAFGQPTSAFGQPAQGASAFTQPNQPTSAFGQPTSAFGQLPAQPASVFEKTSQPTSAFGQPSQPKSAFGQVSQPTSAFGQPSQPTAFGQSSLIKPASGAFGSTAPNTAAAGGGGSGAFSAFASQPSSFASAAASTTPSLAFGQSAFGAAPPTQSAFSTAPAPAPQSVFASAPQSAFGTSSTSGFAGAPSAVGAPSPASAVGGSPFTTSPTTVTLEKPAPGKPDFASAKSRCRAKPGADRYADLLPPNYTDIIPAEVKAAFLSDKFEWGKIPEWIPPKEVR
ncbi:hypothetical protein BU15DRAFT_77894 [Melanogaster broomeanus]|nr:hypothetical protein BU15DRAFT_77894 [Melanogaster broomeanus]